jgi:hypothetical protein
VEFSELKFRPTWTEQLCDADCLYILINNHQKPLGGGDILKLATVTAFSPYVFS